MSDVIEDFKVMVVFWLCGCVFDEFEVGEDCVYYWGCIIIEVDVIQFVYLIFVYNLFYFNCEYVKVYGYFDIVVCL